ncbi:LysR family transcriptional regulator [Rhizobium sp. BR 362]|uniref:LysR family transcriptional regulator n=1 Tax=Rhizobium sp. BR 362 TaxID=3040670 RepID=UPI002F4137F3
MRQGNFDEIITFMSVVEAGGFVGGAKLMGLSRSAAGKSLARLENRLGVRLINRTTRSFSLTDEGKTFHDRCKLILTSMEEAEASIRAAPRVPTGSLRISVPDAFGRRYVLPLVREYMERWPDLRVEVSFTDRASDLVEEGVDLAVRIGTSVSDAKSDTRLVSRIVAQFEAVLCASPEYLLKKGEPLFPEDLASHDCLLFASAAHRQVLHLREPSGGWIRSNARCRLKMDNGEAILDAALAGMGIALLPTFLTDTGMKSGRLVRILPDYQTENAPITAIYPTKQFLSAKVRHLIDLMAERWSHIRVKRSS